jgi:hypothetical protein
MHNTKPNILRLFFILFLLKIAKERPWFFRTIIVLTPLRSVTRCVEPAGLGFIPQENYCARSQ